MKLLVRNEIIEVIEDCSPNYSKYFIKLFVAADTNEYQNVNFNLSNCNFVEIEDTDCSEYLGYMDVNTIDILLVSTLLCDGFIKAMRGYSDTLKTLILDK